MSMAENSENLRLQPRQWPRHCIVAGRCFACAVPRPRLVPLRQILVKPIPAGVRFCRRKCAALDTLVVDIDLMLFHIIEKRVATEAVVVMFLRLVFS